MKSTLPCLFLSSYWQADATNVSAQAHDEVVALVASHPGITLQMLLARLETATSDDVYRLCAEEQVFVDLYAAPLAEPERVPVFRDQPTAHAWATALRQEDEAWGNRPHPISIEPGAIIVWDGRLCSILYQGQTTITLLTEDRHRLRLGIVPPSNTMKWVDASIVPGFFPICQPAGVFCPIRVRPPFKHHMTKCQPFPSAFVIARAHSRLRREMSATRALYIMIDL